MNMKITLDNPPEGFEAEAEYKIPSEGECLLFPNGEVGRAGNNGCLLPMIVLIPISPPLNPPQFTYENFDQFRDWWWVHRGGSAKFRILKYNEERVYFLNPLSRDSGPNTPIVSHLWTHFNEYFRPA